MTSLLRSELDKYWSAIMPQLPDCEDILYVGTAGNTPEKAIPWLAGKSFKTMDCDPQWNPDVVADIRATGMPDNSYGMVIVSQVIEHTYDKAQVLRECLRVLRPDGWLLLDCPWQYPYHPEPPSFGDYWRISADGLRQMLRDAGYSRIHAHQGANGSYAWATKPAVGLGFNAIQQEDSSYSRQSKIYGPRALAHIRGFANMLRGDTCEDDTFADFGGNDGLCAEKFQEMTGRPMLVVDALETRLAVAREHGLQTVRAELEHLPLPDKSIAWGFCSNTLEHTWDINLALKEMARVCIRGVYIAVPLESRRTDPAHNFTSSDYEWWLEQAITAGFRAAPTRSPDECFAFFAAHPGGMAYLEFLHNKLVEQGMSGVGK